MKIKCPVCGNEEFVPINIPTKAYYWNTIVSLESSADYKACTKCGLVLMFDQHQVSDYFEEKRRNEAKQVEIQKKKDKIKSLQKEKEKLETKLTVLEKEKQDPNRTVARDQELATELRKVKSRLSSIPTLIARLNNDITHIR